MSDVNIEKLNEALEGASAAAASKKEEEAPAKEFKFSVEEYLLNGFVSREINKRLFKAKIRTLKNDETIEIYNKIAKSDVVTRAQVDAVMETYSVGAGVVELNGNPLKDRKAYNSTEEFIAARYEMAKNWGGVITDVLNVEINKLTMELRTALEEPEELVKN